MLLTVGKNVLNIKKTKILSPYMYVLPNQTLNPGLIPTVTKNIFVHIHPSRKYIFNRE